jgi:hypothetical protein
MTLYKMPNVRQVGRSGRRCVPTAVRVLLLLLGSAGWVEGSVAQVPPVCSADQGRAIAACAQTCEAPCNSPAFRRATPMAEQLCLRTGRGRPDAPGCAGWTEGRVLPAFAAAPSQADLSAPSRQPPSPLPPAPSRNAASDRPSQQWCESVSGNANLNFMRDVLAQIPNAEERASLEPFLRTLPECAHALGPQGVARRLACTGIAAEDLDRDLNSMGSISFPANSSPAARREFCQRFDGSLRGADVRKRLTDLQGRTTATQSLFDGDSRCIGQLRDWVTKGGRSWSEQNPAMGEVSGPMIDMVEQSANEGQENIAKITTLLRTIEDQLSRRSAAVTLFSLVCVVPGEGPEPAPQPSASPPRGGR